MSLESRSGRRTQKAGVAKLFLLSSLEVRKAEPRRREVKSANTIDRTLELLEFFASEQGPLCGIRVRDVVHSLDFAQSTASVLLNRLAELGYLRRADRHYFPTPRLGVLGNCYLENHPEARELEDYLAQIHDSTGHLCFLAQRNGANLQYISFKKSIVTNYPTPRNGLMRPLAIAASGRALLSLIAAEEARRIIRRNNSETIEQEWRVSEHEVMSDLQLIRDTGFARSDPFFTPGLIGFATWLVTEKDRVPYAIGVAIPAASSSRKAELAIRALADLTSRFELHCHCGSAIAKP